MKIERLIGILFYILNRNCVSATTLAKHFGVSRRTILRDIDTLTLAGIPLYSEIGSKGGYSIARDYKLSEKLIDTANSEYMLLALKSLKDIYSDKKVTETYEKVKHIFPSSINENTMEIDLSVINENKYVIDTVFELKKAVQQKSNISFDYTNSQSKSNIESNNTIISELEMKEDDFVLFSILIGFGDKIKVLSPLSFSQKIQDHLKSTLEIYQKQ